jgi:hypothetical protein
MLRMPSAVICITVLILTSGVVALLKPQSTIPTSDASISEATDSVYAVVIEQHVLHVGEGAHPKLLVFEASTVPFPCFDEIKDNCPEMIKKNLERVFPNQLESETILDALARNKSVVPLSTTFHTDLPRVFITSQERNNFFEASQKKDGWKSFYTRYPKSGGFLALSQVGFNSRHDQALVYSSNSCGWLCGAGFYNLLNKKDGKWVLVNRYMAWIS